MKQDGNKLLARTEEIQHIIERMPTKFGIYISVIVVSVFASLVIFGCIVRYPDIITAQITINSNQAPIKLVANTYGKLKLVGPKHLQNVGEGQLIAYLENSAHLSSILTLDSFLKKFNPNTDDISKTLKLLPTMGSYGEINAKYTFFLSNAHELNNYNVDRLIEKQVQNLTNLLQEQNKAIAVSAKRVDMSLKNLEYARKFYIRDSTLYVKRVISESEFDRSQMNYLKNKDDFQDYTGAMISNRQNAQQTQSKIKELNIQKSEKLKELKIATVTSYNDLTDAVKLWEQKYLFKAPFSGTLQYLKFWVDDQFVQSGETVFTVVPKKGRASGQLIIPAYGAGKVEIGQEVIVKLESHPYTEYGTIKGIVSSISMSTTTSKTDKGEIENYLATVDFPFNLKTSYGTNLKVNLETKGTAEIITKDRKLIERFFDNIHYALKK